MRYLKGFLKVLFLKVLFQHTGVEVVVHVVVQPCQCTLLNGLETLRSYRLAICRFFDTHEKSQPACAGRTSQPSHSHFNTIAVPRVFKTTECEVDLKCQRSEESLIFRAGIPPQTSPAGITLYFGTTARDAMTAPVPM